MTDPTRVTDPGGQAQDDPQGTKRKERLNAQGDGSASDPHREAENPPGDHEPGEGAPEDDA
jgi:hypothetical protein